MQATYHIKGKEINHIFLSIIRKLFRDDENITITVVSEKAGNADIALIEKLSELEEKYPPKQIDKNFDFNAAVDTGINL